MFHEDEDHESRSTSEGELSFMQEKIEFEMRKISEVRNRSVGGELAGGNGRGGRSGQFRHRASLIGFACVELPV